ncbi:MAG: hypothetical protein HYV23_07515 [Deltaproteobacteria bacterium]|nr:hypothetical protein [Deltaproteobacteria bacterium]
MNTLNSLSKKFQAVHSGQVQESKTLSRHWDPALGKLLMDSSSSSLSGSGLPSMRNVGVGSTIDLGTTNFIYDGFGRVSTTTTVKGSSKTIETRQYLAGQPLPTSITSQVLINGLSLPYSGQAGTSYTYGAGPYYWLASETDLLSGETTTYNQRDSVGRVTVQTDSHGVTTRTQYDASGRTTSSIRNAMGVVGQPDYVGSITTTYQYGPSDTYVIETVTVEGVLKPLVTRKDFDSFGRLVKVTRPDGSYQITTYNGFDEKLSETPWLQVGQTNYGATTFAYDSKGRLSTVADAQGRVLMSQPNEPAWGTRTVGSVTAVGEVSSTLDDRGNEKTQVKDLLGQVSLLVDAAGGSSSFGYDAYGHLQVATRGGQSRSYIYNELGWLLSRSEPEEGTTEYSDFTALGAARLTKQKGKSGSSSAATQATLDGRHRLSALTGLSGAQVVTNRTISYRDDFNLPVSVNEVQPYGTLVETYGYDRIGRAISRSYSDGSRTFSIAQELDALGNVKTLTYPSASSGPLDKVTFTFDDYLRPQTTLFNGVNRGQAIYNQVSGTAVTSTVLYGNGASTALKADKGELVHVTQSASTGVVEDAALTWTAGGLLTNRGSDSFTYDGLRRLTGATVYGLNPGEVTTQSFQYDTRGNRTSSGFTYTGSQKPDELLAWTATYDGTNGIPSQVQTPNSAALQTGAQYDDFGRLTQIWSIPGQSGSQTSWAYDPAGRVLMENGTSFMLDSKGLRMKRMKADGSISYTIYGFNREPLSSFEITPQIVTSQAQSLVSSPTSGKKGAQSAMVISPGDEDPIPAGAYITAPASNITVNVGQVVAFDGYSDYGRTFSWSFGDGTTGVTSSTVTNTNHAFAVVGSYTVRFTARATGYLSSSSTVVITVVQPPPVITSFTASRTTIVRGESTTLTWSTTNTTSLSLNTTGTVTGTSLWVSPTVTTLYKLTASGSGGSSVVASILVEVVQPPVIASFSATPSNIYQGDSSTLGWTTTNTTSVSLSNGIGVVPGTTCVVNPSSTTTYTLTATNSLNGVSTSITAAVTVTVSPRPTVPTIGSFTADSTTLGAGTGTTLRWSITNSVGAVNVTLNGVSVSASGTQSITPSTTTTYTLTATNSADASKTVSASVTITVVQKPLITFTTNAATIYSGSPATLNWSVSNSPTSLSIDQGIGAVSPSGSRVVSPATTTTYTMSASNLGGTTTAQITITVTQQPTITTFTASATQINRGDSITLSWAVQGATGVTINGVSVSGGSTVMSPAVTTTYTLVASNPAGTDTRAVSVIVVIPPAFSWTKTLVYGFGQLISEERGTGTTYVHSDYVGSPNILTNSSGQVVGRTKSLPYGERYGQTGEKSALRYAGHEDQDGSPIYMQARVYLPTYGRFAQPDPWYDQDPENPDSLNLYVYVANNPVTNVDPTGMRAVDMSRISSDGWFDYDYFWEAPQDKKADEKFRPKSEPDVILEGTEARKKYLENKHIYSEEPTTSVPAQAEPEKPLVSSGVGGTWVSPWFIGGGGRLTFDNVGNVYLTATVAVGSPGVGWSLDAGPPPSPGGSWGVDARGGGGKRPSWMKAPRVLGKATPRANPTLGGSADNSLTPSLGLGGGTPGIQGTVSYTWIIRHAPKGGAGAVNSQATAPETPWTSNPSHNPFGSQSIDWR